MTNHPPPPRPIDYIAHFGTLLTYVTTNLSQEMTVKYTVWHKLVSPLTPSVRQVGPCRWDPKRKHGSWCPDLWLASASCSSLRSKVDPGPHYPTRGSGSWQRGPPRLTWGVQLWRDRGPCSLYHCSCTAAPPVLGTCSATTQCHIYLTASSRNM